MKARMWGLTLALALGFAGFNVAEAATVEKQELLDPTFLFRGALSLVLAGLAWYGNRMANKLEELERKVVELSQCNNRLTSIEATCTALRREDSQIQAQLNLLRENILREYHTKEDIREHHHNMEKLVSGMREEVRNLCEKLETLQERFYEQNRSR